MQDINWRERITHEMREQYRHDGVLCIPELIHSEWIALIEQGIQRNILNPGHSSITMHAGVPGEYFMDYGNFEVNPEYQYHLRHSPIAEVMQYMLDTEELWLFHDQVFVKTGGDNMPTFWHP